MTIFFYYLGAIVYYKKIHVKDNSIDSFKKTREYIVFYFYVSKIFLKKFEIFLFYFTLN